MKTVINTTIAVGILLLTMTGCQSVYVTSAKVYLQQNDLANAEAQLKEGLAQNPNDAQAHYLLGEIYAKQKKYSEMMQEFDASLALSDKYRSDITKIKNSHFESLYNEAVDNFNKKETDKTVEGLQTALLIAPEDREAWSLLGKTYIRANRFDEGKEALRKAIALDPKFEDAGDRILLMEICYNNHEYENALTSAEEILRKEAANKDAVKVAAFCYNQLALKEEDLQKKSALQGKALEYYQQVLANNPNDTDFLFNLGLLYEMMGRNEEALAQFERIYELNPKDKEAILHLAQTYLEDLKDYDKSIEYYKIALELDPDNPGIWNNLGVAQIRAGDAREDASLIEAGKASIEKARELQEKNDQK